MPLIILYQELIMLTGTVIRFNKIKGYGFIKADEGENEVFVHFSKIQQSGYKELQVGQRVQYDIEVGEKGEFASHVEII